MKHLINQLFAIATFMTPTLALASDALITATKAGDTAAVIAELERGADVNYRTLCSSLDTGDDCTALMFAAARGHQEVLVTLMDAGADLEATTTLGQRALSFAAIGKVDNSQTIAALITAGAETEHTSGEWGFTPLRWAINKHKAENAIALIELGVDLNAPDVVGDSSIHGAIYQRQADILRALLAHDADPAFLNDRKQNAFVFAHNWDRAPFAHPILSEYHPNFCDTAPCEVKKFVFKPSATQ